MSSSQVLNFFFWLLVLLLFSWWFSFLCLPFYIVLSVLAVFFEGLETPAAMLLQGVKFPQGCARKMALKEFMEAAYDAL